MKATVKPVVNGYEVYYNGIKQSFHVTLESANREADELNRLGK